MTQPLPDPNVPALSRRHILRLGLFAAAGSLLAACSSSTTSQSPAAQPTSAGAAACGGAPTAAPAAKQQAPAASGGVVDITFLTSADGHTMVLLKHGGLASHASRENHREGWRRILDSLAAVLERISDMALMFR